MVAAQFIDFLSKFQVSTYVGVEDFADKFNFLYTVILLLVCTLIVTLKQYVLKPISCYIATDVGGYNLMEYTENYCWVEGTVPITYTGKIPSTKEEWTEFNKLKILYYQWVPFVLGLQCIMFHLPRLIWQIFCYNYTGTDISHLITSANQAVHSSEEAKHKMVCHIAKTMEQMLYQHRDNRSGHWAKLRRRIHQMCNFLVMSKRQGTRLLLMYFCIKLLYLLNNLCQLILMKRFLTNDDQQTNTFLFGFEVMKNISLGRDWKSTLLFPRVGYCYVPLKALGVDNTAVAQCVLPVNMLNEKIYFFLWCWIFTGLLITQLSIVIWLIRMIFLRRRRGFINRYLKLNHQLRNGEEEKCMITKFENQFLRHDGVFLLKMIAINAGDIIASEVVCQLWSIFKRQYANRNFLNDGSDADEDVDRTLIKLENTTIQKSESGLNHLVLPSAPALRTASRQTSIANSTFSDIPTYIKSNSVCNPPS